MATHCRGTRHPVDRDINLHIEDTEGLKMGPDNDNDCTSGSDTTNAFGGSEVDCHPSKLIPNNQAKLTALVRDMHIYINE